MKPILLFILIFSFNCKKNSISESEKKPIGEIFLYNDEVIMYEKPEASPILKKFLKTDSVKILKTKIPDPKNPQSMYYKVYYENQFGYIPIISEIKKNMFAFLYASPDTKAKIKASSLRLRETPDLNGNVISAVPKSEIVEILWEGQLFEKIDLKYDTWMKIKTKDGKSGFSYAGYITKDLNEDENSFSNYSTSLNSAYIEIKESPIFYSKYRVKVSKNDQSQCGETDLSVLPKNGEIILSTEVSIMNNEKFYYIEVDLRYHGCYAGVRGWISEKQITFIEDIFKYTSEKYGSKFDKKFLEAINKEHYGTLNVKDLSIKDFQFNTKEKYKFFKVNNQGIFFEKNREYYFAGHWNYGLNFDINQDGNDELINPKSGCYSGDITCESPPASIAIWNGKEIKEIYLNKPMNKIELQFKDKLVIENLTEYDGDPYSSDPNRIPKISTNYYEIKDFGLVPTKRRPKKS